MLNSENFEHGDILSEKAFNRKIRSIIKPLEKSLKKDISTMEKRLQIANQQLRALKKIKPRGSQIR